MLTQNFFNRRFAKRFPLSFAAALTALLFGQLIFPQTAISMNLREELLFASVQIVAVSETGDVFTGSGTTISRDGLVLTNYHVVADRNEDEPYPSLSLCYTVSQYLPPRCVATAVVVALNEANDLALLRPDKKINRDGSVSETAFSTYWRRTGKSFYAAPFDNVEGEAPLPNILDRLTVWGYPGVGGATITVTSGFVSGFDTRETASGGGSMRFIKTDAGINPGNSGGTAFNEFFSFIGVPSNTWPGQMGFIIPLETVVEWLRLLDNQDIINLNQIDSMRSHTMAFSDLQNDSLQDIARLLKHLEIMRGYDDNTFRPDQLMKHPETVSAVLAAKRITPPSVSQSCAEGVDPSAWFAPAVCYAYSQNWLSGPYNPNAFMRGEDFANLLSRAMGWRAMFKNAGGDFLTRRRAAMFIFELIAPYKY